MKSFTEFLKEADVPTNVTGAAVSTDQPVVTKVATNKYKRKNMAAAPKPIKEADINAVGDSYVTPDEANLYVRRNNEDTLKISKLLKKLLSKK
jgi:poly-gamma-glutamate capsule biosynthesis protein CapA/YwtB (metallophosphatase superfamily)